MGDKLLAIYLDRRIITAELIKVMKAYLTAIVLASIMIVPGHREEARALVSTSPEINPQKIALEIVAKYNDVRAIGTLVSGDTVGEIVQSLGFDLGQNEKTVLLYLYIYNPDSKYIGNRYLAYCPNGDGKFMIH